MRQFINIVEAATGTVVSGQELMSRYGGQMMAYDDLPQSYQKSLTQWMVVEGENEDYFNESYGVVEVPMEDILAIIYDQLGEDQTFERFWGDGKHGYGAAYSERWPIIWSDMGWEDGMHRLMTYRSRGEESVPVVVVGMPIMESRLDELSRPDTRDAERILAAHGYERVGSGGFSVVWGKPNSKTVLKLIKAEDEAYMDFVKLALKHQDNPHFPRFSSKIIRLNDDYKAVRMERLVAGKGEADNYRSMAAYVIERYILRKGNIDSVADYVRDDINKVFEQYPRIQEACDLIIANLSHHQNDLHPGNVMFRGDTMVITDPVAIRR